MFAFWSVIIWTIINGFYARFLFDIKYRLNAGRERVSRNIYYQHHIKSACICLFVCFIYIFCFFNFFLPSNVRNNTITSNVYSSLRAPRRICLGDAYSHLLTRRETVLVTDDVAPGCDGVDVVRSCNMRTRNKITCDARRIANIWHISTVPRCRVVLIHILFRAIPACSGNIGFLQKYRCPREKW